MLEKFERFNRKISDWVAWIGFGALFQPLRCALSGKAGGPDLFDVMEWLGGEACLRRLVSAIERLAGVAEGES